MDLMKRNRLEKYCAILFFFCSLEAGYSQSAESDSLAGRIEIQCPVSGLNICLDNQSIGKTPLSDYMIGPGEHTIRVQNPDPLNWLSQDWESTFSICKGENRLFIVKFDRTCWIGSSPSGANIFSGGRLIGKTPASVTLPDENLCGITLTYPGYQSSSINLTKQNSRILHVLLKKTGIGETSLSNRHSFLGSKKYWIIGGGIAALASGIAGYYYKDKAERTYRNYLSSGDPEKMNRYFSDSKKYDTCSGVLYGIGEISLGITLFLSIWGSSKN